MTRISTATLAKDLDGVLARVADGHERVVIRRRNKNVAILVPMEDAVVLDRAREAEQDRLDAEEADRRLSDPNEKRIPYSRARKALGLV